MAKLQPDYINWVINLNATQAQEEYAKLSKANKELAAQNNASRRAMAELEKQGHKGSQEWKNLRNSISGNNKAMSETRAKMGELFKRLDTGSMTVKQLQTRLKELQRAFDNTSKAANPKEYERLRQQIIQTKDALRQAKVSTDDLKGSFISINGLKAMVMGFFAGIGSAILGTITGAFSSFFNIIADFESQGSKLAAVLNTDTNGIKELTKAARKLGATTSYSAAEVAGLQVELAKLGFLQDDILAMEEGVMKFAKAVSADLSSAAAFAGAALRIFGKDASETENLLATFAVATTNTALDFGKLEASLSTVGPVAAAFGLSVEDTTALLGQLANSGFDASTAATATRNIILNLCDANGDLAKALGGPARNADELAKGLQKLQAEGIDLAKALELTDKRSVAAFQTFVNGADSLVELRDSITDCKGNLDKMSDTMGNNVRGAMAGLRSVAEELALKIGDSTSGPIKDLVTWLTKLVQKIGEVIKWMQDHGKVIKALVATLVTYKVTILVLTKTWNGLTVAAKLAKTAFVGFRSTVIALKTAITAYKTAMVSARTATEALKLAVTSTPWGAIAATVAAIGVAIYTMSQNEEEAAEASAKLSDEMEKQQKRIKNHAEARDKLAQNIAVEKRRILDLVAIAEDENTTKEKRIKAINELNRICPGYNGHLAKEGAQLKANKKNLDEYIQSMERRMRLAYYKDEYQEYISEQERAKKRLREADKNWLAKAFTSGWQVVEYDDGTEVMIPEENYNGTVKYDPGKRVVGTHYQESSVVTEARQELKVARDAVNAANSAFAEFKKMLDDEGITIADVLSAGEEAVTGLTGGVTELGDSAADTSSKIATLKREILDLRQAELHSDEERRLTSSMLEARREQLKSLGASLNPIDQATEDADKSHQQNLFGINKQKGLISDAQLAVEKNKELIRYCGDLMVALNRLKNNTAETDTDTIQAINKRQVGILHQVANAQTEINKAAASREAGDHQERLTRLQATYDEQVRIVRKALNERVITESQAEIYLMSQEHGLHADQLAELQSYLQQVKDADYLSADEKRKLEQKLANDIKKLQSQVLTDTGEWSQRMRELTGNFTGMAGIKQTFEDIKADINATYDEAIKLSPNDADALNAERNRRLAAAAYQYQEQMWDIRENAGLSWADQFQRELDGLENLHAQGLISEKDYQKKRLKLGMDYTKKNFDYFAALSSSTFSAVQDAEIAKSDAKYDVLIQQAKNNGEDTIQLEQEKENKKLEIQKKYADANFAVKVSQIIADTAVSIMKAFADLGPIAGAIAAGMLTVTGAMQLKTAKAERDKIKNMQPGVVTGTSSGGNMATAERVLSGYADGGYTGDGGRYEVAGLVHRGEYVVPKPIMADPRVIDAVGLIEAIRNHRMGPARTPMGYADGGYTESATHSGITSADIAALRDATNNLRNAVRSIRAYVVLQDIDKASDRLKRAQAPFTR